MNLFLVLASALRAGSTAIAGAFPLQDGSVLTRNNLFRHAVSFDFVRIAGLADAELCLEHSSVEKLEHGLIADGLLELRQRASSAAGAQHGIGRSLAALRRRLTGSYSYCRFLAHKRIEALDPAILDCFRDAV